MVGIFTEGEAYDNVCYGSIRRILLNTTAINSGAYSYGRA